MINRKIFRRVGFQTFFILNGADFHFAQTFVKELQRITLFQTLRQSGQLVDGLISNTTGRQQNGLILTQITVKGIKQHMQRTERKIIPEPFRLKSPHNFPVNRRIVQFYVIIAFYHRRNVKNFRGKIQNGFFLFPISGHIGIFCRTPAFGKLIVLVFVVETSVLQLIQQNARFIQIIVRGPYNLSNHLFDVFGQRTADVFGIFIIVPVLFRRPRLKKRLIRCKTADIVNLGKNFFQIVMFRKLKISVSDTQTLIQAAVSLQSEIGFVAHYIVKIGSRCPGCILITIVKIKIGTVFGNNLRKLIRKFGYRFPNRFAPRIPAAFFLQTSRHLGGNFLFADKSRRFGKIFRGIGQYRTHAFHIGSIDNAPAADNRIHHSFGQTRLQKFVHHSGKNFILHLSRKRRRQNHAPIQPITVKLTAALRNPVGNGVNVFGEIPIARIKQNPSPDKIFVALPLFGYFAVQMIKRLRSGKSPLRTVIGNGYSKTAVSVKLGRHQFQRRIKLGNLPCRTPIPHVPAFFNLQSVHHNARRIDKSLNKINPHRIVSHKKRPFAYYAKI